MLRLVYQHLHLHQSHGFVAGSQFRVLDNNNNKLGDFFVKTVVGVNTFSSTTSVQLASPTTVLPNGMGTPATPTSDKENENIGSRGLAFYDNETFNLGADVTTGTSLRYLFQMQVLEPQVDLI